MVASGTDENTVKPVGKRGLKTQNNEHILTNTYIRGLKTQHNERILTNTYIRGLKTQNNEHILTKLLGSFTNIISVSSDSISLTHNCVKHKAYTASSTWLAQIQRV